MGSMFFSAPYLFIISSPFSGMPSKPNESSISGAKVFSCSSRRRKVKPYGFVEKSSSFPIGRAYSPEKGLVYLFSTIRGVFTNLKREKIISVEEWDTGHGIL